MGSNSAYPNIIAKSGRMLQIFEVLDRLAKFKTTVLICGESGTGKELIARAIHDNSPRSAHPFVAVNCGAIPENLMESELFGHKKGSFTDATRDKPGLFEEANFGTIFLDEIGEMPLQLQVKLLRALQEQSIRRVGDEQDIKIDARIIAATNRDLEDLVMLGKFRDDLFYRLNVVSINLPALRERKEDIAPLVEHLIDKHNKKLGLQIRSVSDEVLELLQSYNWRGNVRELENCIERAMVLSRDDQLRIDSISSHIKEYVAKQKLDLDHSNSLALPSLDDGNLSIKQKVRELESALIKRALEKTDNNRTHAAKLLEISHRTLLYKLKEYGLGKVEDDEVL